MSVSFDNIKLYNTDARSDIFFPFGTKKSSDEKSCRLNVFLHLLIPIYLSTLQSALCTSLTEYRKVGTLCDEIIKILEKIFLNLDSQV